MRAPLYTSIATLISLLACSAGPVSPSATAASATAAATTTAPAAVAAPTTPAPTTDGIPSMYQKFGSAVTVRLDGDMVVLTSNGVPDHPSPYFGVGDPRYEAPKAGMTVNPNVIAEQHFVFRVPASPAVATPSDTPLGPIGMATNGVALFNQYAAGRQPLTYEIFSFDQYNGHPQQTGVYHYHLEPLWLTRTDKSALVGVLLDGFPVYGPMEADGSTPTGLDSCNGHTHATPDFPNGIYHYHVTATSPYISGCFKGTPGTAG